jgi:RND family efflux transporter MFP subunit
MSNADIRVGKRYRGAMVPKLMLVIALATVVGLTVVFGVMPRIEAREKLREETAAHSVMTVSVTTPKTASDIRELVLPGNMQAYLDTSIYARQSGYIKRWYADIGAHVKEGDLLAEIDTPEIDDQLQQARADVAVAEANYRLAFTTAKRWEDLVDSGVVTKQGVDEKRGELEARKSALDAARFSVNRLQKMQSFKRIHAPFDGVITARNVDVGALIDAGAGQSMELFHIVSTRKLRVYVNIPQAYARDAQPGVKAELTLPEYPGQRFKGTLVRSTQSIDPRSRTMLAEVEVDNEKGVLLSGGYAQVHLTLRDSAQTLILPVNVLLFRPEGVMVAVVQPDQHALLTPVTLGRDFGREVEVVDGLSATDSIIVNPSDSLVSGTEVRVVKDEAVQPKA